MALAKHNVIIHLIKCYKNHRQYSDLFNKYNTNMPQESFEDAEKIKSTLKMTLEQIFLTTTLVLTDRIYENLNIALDQSALLELYYQDRVPDDFLFEFINVCYEKTQDFEFIFSQMLRGLFMGMQRNLCSPTIITHHMELLSKLMGAKVGAARPLCDLLAKQMNFLPPLCTQIPGREIVKCSYLGPFLSVSFFAEENVRFAEAHGKCDALAASSGKFRWVSKTYLYSYIFDFFLFIIFIIIFFFDILKLMYIVYYICTYKHFFVNNKIFISIDFIFF